MKIYNFNFIIFLIINLFDKTLSVDNNLCAKNRKIRSNFAEIFGQKWENETDQIDQNSNSQNDQNDLNSAVFDGSNKNNNQLDDEHKCEIIHKFHAIKEGIKKKGKYSAKNLDKIERKIAKKLGINRTKIYEWKKEFGLSRKIKINKKNYYKKKKKEFVERINEIKRMSKGKQKQFVEEFGISEDTFRKWKKKFGIEIGKKRNEYLKREKIAKMNFYYKTKKEHPSLSDKEIAEFLKIGTNTLRRWKKQKDLLKLFII